eukprot:scpid43487/ scgid32660/ 
MPEIQIQILNSYDNTVWVGHTAGVDYLANAKFASFCADAFVDCATMLAVLASGSFARLAAGAACSVAAAAALPPFSTASSCSSSSLSMKRAPRDRLTGGDRQVRSSRRPMEVTAETLSPLALAAFTESRSGVASRLFSTMLSSRLSVTRGDGDDDNTAAAAAGPGSPFAVDVLGALRPTHSTSLGLSSRLCFCCQVLFVISGQSTPASFCFFTKSTGRHMRKLVFQAVFLTREPHGERCLLAFLHALFRPSFLALGRHHHLGSTR